HPETAVIQSLLAGELVTNDTREDCLRGAATLVPAQRRVFLSHNEAASRPGDDCSAIDIILGHVVKRIESVRPAVVDGKVAASRYVVAVGCPARIRYLFHQAADVFGGLCRAAVACNLFVALMILIVEELARAVQGRREQRIRLVEARPGIESNACTCRDDECVRGLTD